MTLTATDLLNTLQTKRPVSIIRAGDGEKIVLESNNDIPSYRLCIESVMKRQVGYEPTMSEVEAIRQNLITAYNGADIVGIPMHERLKDMNKHSYQEQLRYIFQHYHQLNEPKPLRLQHPLTWQLLQHLFGQQFRLEHQ